MAALHPPAVKHLLYGEERASSVNPGLDCLSFDIYPDEGEGGGRVYEASPD